MSRLPLRSAALFRTLVAVGTGLLVLTACAENRLEASVQPGTDTPAATETTDRKSVV